MKHQHKEKGENYIHCAIRKEHHDYKHCFLREVFSRKVAKAISFHYSLSQQSISLQILITISNHFYIHMYVYVHIYPHIYSKLYIFCIAYLLIIFPVLEYPLLKGRHVGYLNLLCVSVMENRIWHVANV